MFSYLLKVSRPRFWLYLLGPYLVATVIVFNKDPIAMFMSTEFWIWFLYFILPANFLIYGVNDLADQDTDKFNSKKNSYEVKFEQNKLKYFIWIFVITNIPFLFFTNNGASFVALVLFYFFGVFYSLEPIRAKSKPIIDSVFNVLYILPGIFGYLNFNGGKLDGFNFWLFLAATFWCMAMHTFSAIPDIEADTKAKLKTTAVLLKQKGSLIYCGGLYLASSLIASYYVSAVFLVFALVYLGVIIYCYKNLELVFKVYKIMPSINMTVGFCIFWIAVFL